MVISEKSRIFAKTLNIWANIKMKKTNGIQGEAQRRQAFKDYLSNCHGAKIQEINVYGVDVVADIEDERLYFELKTSDKDQVQMETTGYFGAITQNEWLCALTFREKFYLVFVIDDKNNKVGKDFKFFPVKFRDLFSYASLEPFATYINIPANTFRDTWLKSTEKNWDMSHKNFKKVKQKPYGIDEHFILKYQNFYLHQKLDKKNIFYNKCKTKSYVFYVIPTMEIDNYINHTLAVNRRLHILKSCSYEKVSEYIKTNYRNKCNTTSFAIIKIQLQKTKCRILEDGEQLLITQEILIKSSDIVEMYFTLPSDTQDFGKIRLTLF